ncbi:tRNA-uridine aminocarboxypropyltransferase [Aliiglaciecola sp. M165]|uniref:tRNA-uridine aminocarboxypropyltransferase n=1 Tax=Aliiglaciecola sp. M165 TaxID=2593649 RepID=UPI0011804516|nr:tRNA-uridine aminocarboxypropyltransferase [Aliiglaciecola sp. M165]TRY33437.1 DTW domain-containing protein [Aliiglaciecola sp. M165]
MPKRSICERCHYPQNVCVCDAIRPVNVPLKLIVLQHPSEVKHAKNTARLVPLCVKQCEIHVGESAKDFEHIVPTMEDAWLIYPSKTSQPLESTNKKECSPKRLIFIDATWKKAFKLYQLNPWLHTLPSWHFDQVPDNQYHIRKTTLTHSVSTLEAIAYALKLTTEMDSEPLLNVLHRMQSHRQRFTDKR